VHSTVLFVLLCTVNWLHMEGLNIEVGDGQVTWGSAPAHLLTLTIV